MKGGARWLGDACLRWFVVRAVLAGLLGAGSRGGFKSG